MEANVRTPRELFDGKVCYQIPVFQRPYVWTEEDQWQPLWDDISRVARVSSPLMEMERSSLPRRNTFLARLLSNNCRVLQATQFVRR